MANKYGVVRGTIEFYGKVDNYNRDGREYCLCIANPEFEGVDSDEIKKAYPRKIPNLYKHIIAGDQIEKAYFNSTYPVTRVYVKGADGKPVEIDVDNPELKGLECKMIMNKTYIGTLLLNKAPETYHKNPFNMEDFGDIDI